MVAMVLVRTAAAEEWQVLRDIRLTALRDTPFAFGSTHAEEALLPEQHWRDRAGRGSSFLAYLPEVSTTEPVGLAAGYLETPGMAELVSMWVSPQARGRGVGEALIARVADWARGQADVTTLHLWVTTGNKPARLLYERCGFALTGEGQPLPRDPSLHEVAMSRPLYSALRGLAAWRPARAAFRGRRPARNGRGSWR
jgi:GNAT superfamily N-acetyltransferase